MREWSLNTDSYLMDNINQHNGKHALIEQTRPDNQKRLVTDAVNSGIDRYITSRKAKVSEFVERYFSFKGALKLHRKAFGRDLYKAPLNIMWLIPLTINRAATYVLEKIGAEHLADLLKRMPSGWETDVQKEVSWLIYTELLELPYQQDGRESRKDVLLEEILRDPGLNELLAEYLSEINQKSSDPDFRKSLEQNLREYATSRIAVSELAGSLITLSTNYAAFHKAAPGALSSGTALAGIMAEKIAISQFWLGPTLGAWYYSLFPVAASTGLVIAATSSILAGLAIITTFTGIVTDPIQARLGLHQKRLYKFLDTLHAELSGAQGAEFHLKEQYIARIFDIIDLLMAALRK